MALKSTIFKLDLNVSDMDRHYYATHQLTIARHPSETDERMMLRIAIFALHAHDRLVFTKGLSSVDEPDLWQKSYTDEIDFWIDLGQPDEKRIRQACGKAKSVHIYCYATKSALIWWDQISKKVQRFDNLKIHHISEDVTSGLVTLTKKIMELQCIVQDGVMWLGDTQQSIEVNLDHWKS